MGYNECMRETDKVVDAIIDDIAIARAIASVAVPIPAAAMSPEVLPPGTRIIVQNQRGNPINGEHGVVRAFDRGSGLHVVQLATSLTAHLKRTSMRTLPSSLEDQEHAQLPKVMPALFGPGGIPFPSGLAATNAQRESRCAASPHQQGRRGRAPLPAEQPLHEVHALTVLGPPAPGRN